MLFNDADRYTIVVDCYILFFVALQVTQVETIFHMLCNVSMWLFMFAHVVMSYYNILTLYTLVLTWLNMWGTNINRLSCVATCCKMFHYILYMYLRTWWIVMYMHCCMYDSLIHCYFIAVTSWNRDSSILTTHSNMN